MPISIGSILLGGVFGLAAGLLGYKTNALTRAGGLAAAIMGCVVYGVGGFKPSILIIFFFVSSTALTRYRRWRKISLLLAFEKGGQRDAGQVLANGLIVSGFVVLFSMTGSQLALAGVVGAIAVAAADTWATEIGVLSHKAPRSILSGQVVPHGTSGGVTLLGNGMSVLGALSLGALAALLYQDNSLIAIGLLGGVAGALVDSLLGARWQAMYFCLSCELDTEKPDEHHCGTQTIYQRGWRWLNNDMVNLLATLSGASLSVVLASIWAT